MFCVSQNREAGPATEANMGEPRVVATNFKIAFVLNLPG